MPYTLTHSASLVPGRLNWEATDKNGKNLASGHCAQTNYPQFAHQCTQDALRHPYEERRKAFTTPEIHHVQPA